ncbi:putative membrane protein [Agromyces hippuratus]|uniref:Putative membrane protein n=1 Tax=Agromyces hippuratus TaxID=286438 RepID=A0A852X854_9MICO|nr:anthrone oxygenase family protein [Agromyces hippuratus]NYG22095.1 putative membrane protein [Agromyces hippuratus]
MPASLEVLLVVAILGTGLVAGVFFAFSGFVTQGIGRLPAADAARAMREINVTAVRAPLMLAIFGTALVVAVLAVFAFLGEPEGATWWSLGGAALYLVGVVGVTGGANVPRNNRLAAAAETDASALAAAWTAFRPGWLAWNHVRTIASTAACLAFVLALVG